MYKYELITLVKILKMMSFVSVICTWTNTPSYLFKTAVFNTYIDSSRVRKKYLIPLLLTNKKLTVPLLMTNRNTCETAVEMGFSLKVFWGSSRDVFKERNKLIVSNPTGQWRWNEPCL